MLYLLSAPLLRSGVMIVFVKDLILRDRPTNDREISGAKLL